jgi:hypothetical protein
MTEKAQEQKERIKKAYEKRDAQALGEMVLNGDIAPESADFVNSALKDFNDFLVAFKSINDAIAPCVTPENVKMIVDIFKPLGDKNRWGWTKVLSVAKRLWDEKAHLQTMFAAFDKSKVEKVEWKTMGERAEHYGFDVNAIIDLVEQQLPKKQ